MRIILNSERKYQLTTSHHCFLPNYTCISLLELTTQELTAILNESKHEIMMIKWNIQYEINSVNIKIKREQNKKKKNGAQYQIGHVTYMTMCEVPWLIDRGTSKGHNSECTCFIWKRPCNETSVPYDWCNQRPFKKSPIHIHLRVLPNVSFKIWEKNQDQIYYAIWMKLLLLG